jgi:hypothetical protein
VGNSLEACAGKRNGRVMPFKVLYDLLQIANWFLHWTPRLAAAATAVFMSHYCYHPPYIYPNDHPLEAAFALSLIRQLG